MCCSIVAKKKKRSIPSVIFLDLSPITQKHKTGNTLMTVTINCHLEKEVSELNFKSFSKRSEYLCDWIILILILHLLKTDFTLSV